MQDPGPLFAQDPRPKARAKTKTKGKAAAKASSKDAGVPPLVADEQINRILGQARTDGRRLPGMVGAVIRGEEISAIGAVGIRRIGSTDPIRVDDVVHLGSNTKAMTATMVGTVVDEGLLRWESTVRDIFPDLVGPDPSRLPAERDACDQILMSHRGGFPHDLSLVRGGGRTDRSFEHAPGLDVSGAPGTRPIDPAWLEVFDYSNTGFVLAGMMAEKVGNAPWEDLMRRRVFGPLGMTSAGFGPPGVRGRSDHASGHRASGTLVEAVYEDNPPSMGPAGTVHCSLPDWAKFASLHLRGSYKGLQLLKPETLKAMHTPKTGEEYAGGWLVGLEVLGGRHDLEPYREQHVLV